jgi:Spy/CpxP family protein refolding chaperone
VLPPFLQQVLKLTDQQKKALEELQKEVDGKLAKILTAEQRKQLEQMGKGPGGPPGGRGGFPGGPPGGPGGFPGPPPGGPGAGGFGPPPGGFGGPKGNSRINQARAELKSTLDNPKHSPAEVRERVAAVRKARQKASADLEAAQKELRQLLTARQEAVLVSLGYID